MSRFIDADKVEKYFDDCIEDIHYFDSADEAEMRFLEAIDEVPTEDVAPVIHAHWIDKSVWDLGRHLGQWRVECSNCHFTKDWKPFSRGNGKGDKYCDECGALMDKEIKKP